MLGILAKGAAAGRQAGRQAAAVVEGEKPSRAIHREGVTVRAGLHGSA